jgi:hypothetical protein
LDDPSYEHFKDRLIKLTTTKEQHRNMHEKLLLSMYQTSSEPKQEREKRKREEDGKLGCGSDKHGKKGEPNHATKSNWEKKFQNNHEALAGVRPAEINQHKADKASCCCCGCNSYHTLECFAKTTSKGTEVATTVAAIMKKAKHQ